MARPRGTAGGVGPDTPRGVRRFPARAYSSGSLSMSRVVPKRTASERSAGPSTRVELAQRRRRRRPRRTRRPRAARVASTVAHRAAERIGRPLAGRPPRRGRPAAPDGATGAAARCSGVRWTLRDESARPSGSRTVGQAMTFVPMRQVARHLADDHHLLGVLLAEVRALRADQAEQDRDHGRDAVEVAGPRRALERPGHRPDGHGRVEAGRIDLLDRRRPDEVDALVLGRSRGRAPRCADSCVKSAASLNWRGLTKIVTTVVAFSARARCISERWPSCSQPIVGTRPTGRRAVGQRRAQLGAGPEDGVTRVSRSTRQSGMRRAQRSRSSGIAAERHRSAAGRSRRARAPRRGPRRPSGPSRSGPGNVPAATSSA